MHKKAVVSMMANGVVGLGTYQLLACALDAGEGEPHALAALPAEKSPSIH